jgi:hypothetical protein
VSLADGRKDRAGPPRAAQTRPHNLQPDPVADRHHRARPAGALSRLPGWSALQTNAELGWQRLAREDT